MSPFDVYQDYLALKQHFTGRYDYFAYNGKVRVNRDSFERRHDRYSFVKLSKQADPHNYLVANLIEDPEMWIGNIVSPEGYQRYTSWMKRCQSLTYIFKQEIENVSKDDFVVVNGQHPRLIEKYMQGVIGIDTFIALCEITKCVKQWNKKIDDTVVWPMVRNRCMKSRKFFSMDIDKLSKIAVDYFKQIDDK